MRWGSKPKCVPEHSAEYWYRLDDAYYDDILLKQGRTAEPSELPSHNKERYS